jgi:hypothetical protein
MVYGFGLNNSSYAGRILRKREYAFICNNLIIGEGEPGLTTLSLGKDYIIFSFKIVGYIVRLRGINNWIEIVYCKVKITILIH